MFGRIFGLGPTGPANNEPVQHEVNQRKEAQDVLEPAPPHPPAATLKPMAPDEITSLTKGGAGVDSVRGHLINANGGSRVLPAGHIEHLLSRLRLNDNRSWLGSVVYSHPNADLIKSLGQLQGEIKGNHSKIFQDPNFIPKGLLEAGNKQTADAINKLLANQAPARIEPMHAVSPVEPPPGEFPAYLRPEHEAKLDQALAKKTSQVDAKLRARLEGVRVRKQMRTAKQIRNTGAESFEESGLTPEEIKITSRQAAYERAGVGVKIEDAKEYRREIGTAYRNPDSLPIEKGTKFKGYEEQQSSNVVWVDPTKSRVTVTGKSIGRGSYADVYAGVDIQGPVVKSTVVKVSRDKGGDQILAGNKIIRDNFTNDEIRNLGLAGVLEDTARRDPQGYLAATDLRYVGDLSKQRLSMSQEQNFAAMKQVARTLKGFHDKQLVHRDIKPANILIDKAGVAHVSDFDYVCKHDSNDKMSGTSGFVDALGKTGKVTYFQDVYALAKMIEQTFSEKAIKGYSGLENALKAVEQANDRTRLELLYPEADFEPSGSEQRDDAYGKLMAALGQE